jgi:hypothetical protein
MVVAAAQSPAIVERDDNGMTYFEAYFYWAL